MNRPAKITALACAGAIFVLAVMAQQGADRVRAQVRGGELLYLPNEKLLNHFTAGMDSIIADLIWLRCVQYIGNESKGERSFIWLNQMLNTTVRLDPYFKDAYRYGGMFLASLRADSEAGLSLLECGIAKRPDTWELPYEAAMVYLLNRSSEPGAKRRAAYYLAMSASTGKAPQFITALAAKLQGEYNLSDVEREMWADLLKSPDQLLRDLAARKLRELELKDTCRVLNERLAQYRQINGKLPDSLTELGLRSDALTDPFGGRFFIDSSGEVQNSTVLDGLETQHRNLIRAALDRFQRERGAWPASLDELVQSGIMSPIPPMPYKERQWIYDPVTGSIK